MEFFVKALAVIAVVATIVICYVDGSLDTPKQKPIHDVIIINQDTNDTLWTFTGDAIVCTTDGHFQDKRHISVSYKVPGESRRNRITFEGNRLLVINNVH